jgi:HK97 family phage major capsid protein
MTRVARVLYTDTGTNLLMPSTTAHGTASWTAESGAYAASDETVGQVSIGGYKAAAKVIVSEELAGDEGIELDQYLADELGARLGVLAETAYVVGDGTGKPLGIAHSSSGVAVVSAATGSSTNFTPADLASAYKALPAAYRPRSTWLLHPDLLANMASRTDSNGGLVFTSLHADPPSLFGRPVEISADLAAPGLLAKSAVITDFQSAYTVRIVRGIGVQRQDEVHSDTGQLGFRAYLRTDGRVVLADAARILQHSAA